MDFIFIDDMRVEAHVGIFEREATMMSSSGFILTVSFQPSSSGHGGLIAPSPLITLALPVRNSMRSWRF